MKRTLLSIALAVGALPLPVQGQRIEGRVNWLGWGEHPDATVQLLDVRLELVESIPVGADGTFVVSVAAGTWHLQAFAGGASSPLTEPIGLNGPQDTVQVVLSIATPLFFQGSQCPAGAPDANGVVVGVVYDDRSSLVLPGALVHLRWDAAPGEAGDAVAETGRHGTYRFCGVPTDRPVELAVQYVDRRAQAAAPLRLEPGVVHREDLRVSLEASTGPIILSAVDATEGSRLDGPLSVIEGRVLDAAADGPLPGARIAISGTDRIATTDAEGRFRLDDVAAGDIVLRVSGPVGNRDVPVRIPRGRVLDVDVWIRAALQQPRHFEAERRRLDQTRFRAANGRDVTGLVVAGEAMADYERAGAELVTILRERFPLRVSYRGSGGVCVEDPRDVLVPDAPVPSSEAVRTPCATILVLLDDDIYRRAVGMPPLPIFLLSLHAQDLESVAFVSRDQLHVVPGLKNAIPRSALILHLRGKGPFVDPLRNRTNERAVESM